MLFIIQLKLSTLVELDSLNTLMFTRDTMSIPCYLLSLVLSMAIRCVDTEFLCKHYSLTVPFFFIVSIPFPVLLGVELLGHI